MRALSLKGAHAVLGSLAVWGLLSTAETRADGMIPETLVVIVKEAEGEASIRVTNSDAHLALLHVSLENIEQDPEPLLFITPPVSRVEAGQQQLVRFILMDKPLRTQRLKRVVFEGIPQGRSASETGQARVGVTVRQNLPVILHPAGLAPNREPWQGLSWSRQGEQLIVSNDTPYVVRLAQQVHLLPQQANAMLPRPYVLPGERLSLELPVDGNALATASAVRLYPATVYGFAVDAYDAPLKAQPL